MADATLLVQLIVARKKGVSTHDFGAFSAAFRIWKNKKKLELNRGCSGALHKDVQLVFFYLHYKPIYKSIGSLAFCYLYATYVSITKSAIIFQHGEGPYTLKV